MTKKSPVRALALYALLSAAMACSVTAWFGLPHSAYGTFGRLAAFGLANYVAFSIVVGRHGVIHMGSIGFNGPWMELLLGAVVGAATTLLFPLGVWALRFGDPGVFTLLGMACSAGFHSVIVSVACGGQDFREMAEKTRAEKKE